VTDEVATTFLMNPLTIARFCNLNEVRRRRGRPELLSLFMPGTDPERSLRPFIRTNSLFIHVPKAAGVSIARALYGNLGMGHLTMEEYRSLFRPSALARMFKFAFVRNPFDRLHSAYHFLRGGGLSDEDANFCWERLSVFPSFEHFVLEGLQKPEIATYWHFLPQCHFLDSGADTLDFIGRFESLEQDFEIVRIRVNPSARLEHINRAPRENQDYRQAYTAEMAKSVAAQYARDLDELGYEFDGVSSAPHPTHGL
jgi:hypothetical protein